MLEMNVSDQWKLCVGRVIKNWLIQVAPTKVLGLFWGSSSESGSSNMLYLATNFSISMGFMSFKAFTASESNAHTSKKKSEDSLIGKMHN